MKPFILFLLFCGLLVSTTAAQHPDREIYPRQVSINHNDAVKTFSRDFVTGFLTNSSSFRLPQLTNNAGNLAAIRVEGYENTTVLSQSGYGITGIIDIDGDNNKTYVQQAGVDLLSVLSIRGNLNRFDMTQQGNSLQNYFRVSGTGLNIDALQTNSGMKLIQSGAGSVPLFIQQTGSPAPVIIRSN